MTKEEILHQALVHREQEVLHHQINIDNYTLAIKEIEANHADDVDIQEFKVRLQELLRTSIIEQTKEKILLKVIAQQLE